MPEMIKATKYICKKCKFKKAFSSSSAAIYCDCLEMTGHMRIRDESGEMCGSYEPKKKKRGAAVNV